jgi:hypothetical protein
VLVAVLWAYAGIRLATGDVPAVAASPALGGAFWIAAVLLPGVVWAVLHRLRLRDERLARCLLAGLFYPVLLLLGLVGTWRAIGRHALRRTGWAKTERLAEAPAIAA